MKKELATRIFYLNDMLIILIILLAIWELYWTSKACWRAAKNDNWYWFLFMLVINLFGFPEIYYLHFKKTKSHHN